MRKRLCKLATDVPIVIDHHAEHAGDRPIVARGRRRRGYHRPERQLDAAQARLETAQAQVVRGAGELQESRGRCRALPASSSTKTKSRGRIYDQAVQTAAAAKATIDARTASVNEARQNVSAAEAAIQQAQTKIPQADASIQSAMTRPQQVAQSRGQGRNRPRRKLRSSKPRSIRQS